VAVCGLQGKSLAYTGTEITLKETGASVCSGRHTKFIVPNSD